jgi:signal transduction histidine kinase
VPSLALWRATLTTRTARVLAVSGGLALLLVVASFLPRSAPAYVWIVVGLYGLGLSGMWITRRSPRLRAVVMLAPFVLIAPFLFAGIGISASAFLGLTMASVLAGVLVGPRAAVAFIVASLLAITITAALLVGGIRPLGPPIPADPLQPQTWIRMALLWLALTSWIVFTVTWLTSRFEASLRAKDEALERLRAEEAQRLEAERRHHQAEMALIESQKRESIGRLAGGIAHDFNNSLLVIMGWNEMLRDGALDEEERRKGHAAIATASDGAAQLARHLLTIGRRQVAIPAPTPLGPLVQEAVRQLERLLPEDIAVRVELEEVSPVVVDRAQMHQVLLNLALNARDAMPRGGTLAMSLRPAPAPAVADLASGARWVELVVSDDGVGMDEATLAHALEPYYTTKAEGRGTGLGLATSHAIVVAAKGRIGITSKPGHGTRVTIHLPVGAATPASETAVRVSPVASAVPGARVAVVEDDDAARALMVMELRSGGYEVLEARDGNAALELLDRHPDSIDLLCIDGVLPGAPVERVVDAFRRALPDRPVLVCSGHVGSERLRHLIEHGQLPLLAKPFTGRELLSRVGELLRAGAPVASGG